MFFSSLRRGFTLNGLKSGNMLKSGRLKAGRKPARNLQSIERLELRWVLSTFTVSTLNDAGAGSFRQAILDANANAGADVIDFSVAGSIQLTTAALPAISGSVNISGNTAPGFTTTPVVQVDFNSFAGLQFNAGATGSALRSLGLENATGAGVTLNGGGTITVTGNYIGVALDGSTPAGNTGGGIELHGSDGNSLLSNVISNNGGNGILIDGSDNNILQVNTIGTDATGAAARANALNGILVTNASTGNLIGGTATGGNNPTMGVFVRPPQGNLISGNTGAGVVINGQSTANTLSGNFIGTTATGNSALGNLLDGVTIDNANSNSLIGCLVTDDPFVYYNVINGNGGNGLRVKDSNDTTIQANFFGLGADNQTPVGNTLNGVVIEGSSAGTLMGGKIPLGNVVAANGQNGIVIKDTASGFVSFNTFCGLAAFQTYTNLGNAQNGMLITSTGGNNLIRTNVFTENGENGIKISGAATGVRVTENIIGLDTNGQAPMGNKNNGIEVSGTAHDIIIGDATPQPSIIPRNTISANGANGVAILGSANNVQVNFSYIGTNINGLVPFGNTLAGVLVGPGTSANTIGSTNTSFPTVISGNLGDGILLSGGSNNTVVSTVIGLNATGNNPLPNAGDGIHVLSSNGNTITTNVISGNLRSGVRLDGSDNNVVQINSIGTDSTGTQDFGNILNGVEITNLSKNNLIGGTASGGNDPTGGVFVRPPQGNLISGNNANGVLITGKATNNTLSGNFIGTVAAGNFSLGNTLDGVAIDDANSNSLIGCLVTDDPFIYYNVVSGNRGNGIRVKNSNGTKIQANFFGLGADNKTPVGNQLNGVLVEGSSAGTQFGGVIPLGNVTAANGQNGVLVQDTAKDFQSFNTFSGVAAFQPYKNLGNHANGALITSTGGNIVLRTSVFSSNGNNGIEIAGAATGVVVDQNIIGTETGGTAASPNGNHGIEIHGTAHDITIGGPAFDTVAPHNVISGNTNNGISISGAARDVQVDLSFIGTDGHGEYAVPNGKAGIFIGPGTQNTTIGSTSANRPTVISGNTTHGIEMRGTTGNTVIGSVIGSNKENNSPIPNGGNGVLINTSSSNTIGGTPASPSGPQNVITNNGMNGVLIESGNNNGIHGNSIYNNALLGISLATGANMNQAAPVLTSVVTKPTGIQITGTLTSTANTTFTIEYYANETSSASGRVYLGKQSVTSNGSGVATLNFSAAHPPAGDRFITATATNATNNTSQYSTFPNPTANDLIGLLRVYALVNTDANIHFYTSNAGERTALLGLINNVPTPHHPWQDAGPSFTSFALFQTPPTGPNVAYVQRLYNTQTGEHYYTTSLGEAAALGSTTREEPAGSGNFIPGWVWENQSQGTTVTSTNAFQGYMYLPDDPGAKSIDNPVGPAGTLPVFRLYHAASGSVQTGDHVLSNDPSQYNAILAQSGWTEHSMLGFAISVPPLTPTRSGSPVTSNAAVSPTTATSLFVAQGDSDGPSATGSQSIGPNLGIAPNSTQVLTTPTDEPSDEADAAQAFAGSTSNEPDVDDLDTFWQSVGTGVPDLLTA